MQDTGKYRKLQPINATGDYIDFSTNDYLMLSKSKELLDAATIAGQKYGVGSTGSRLLSGNSEIFEVFEQQIAKDKNTEAALIFNSGFQANATVLSSLLDKQVNFYKKPIVFFDMLNHSSLYQGVFLSQAELVRYRHNDMNHLESLLNEFSTDPRPKFIITETVFGMDGDVVPMNNIIMLCKKHNAFLYLDEAHATGVFGHRGYGLSTDFDLSEIPHLIMGTFSKALGCSGAYIASSQIIKDYLINKSSGFIYSTALSPMIIGAAAKAWELVQYLGEERKKLMQLGNSLREKLKNHNLGNSTTHIIPVIIGDNEKVMQMKKRLFNEKKIIVSAVRPPTVLPGTARLRIAINVSHTEDDLGTLIF